MLSTMYQRSRSKIPSVEKKVRRLMGRAVHRYGLIGAEDRILVALSGGADSISLLWLLHERLRRIPITYELFAVHIDLGYKGEEYSSVNDWVQSLNIPHHIVQSEFGPKAHSSENSENPCFLCARLRRTALFKEATRLGCNKIALGHNLDDVIETFFLNIIYGSQVSTMLPRQPFFGGEVDVIRPLSLLDAGTIRAFHRIQNFPASINPCPSKNTGKRQEIRELLQSLYRKNRKIRGNILAAMHNINLEYLPSLQDDPEH